MSWFLLMPFASSILFVFAMMLVKRASDRGTSPLTGTILANVWLAMGWGIAAVIRWQIVGPAVWGQASLVALMFVLGQVFTYLAFQLGDVSVATPIFGVKILMVALLNSVVSAAPLTQQIWIGAVLATLGVALVQLRPRLRTQTTSGQPVGASSPDSSDAPPPHDRGRILLTIGMVLIATFCLSCFDLMLQTWGTRQDTAAFLSAVFIFTALLSVVFFPWVDRPRRLRQSGAMKWIVAGTMLMAVQALGMSISLSAFGHAAQINIVYALRGLWGVILTWLLARHLGGNEATLGSRTMQLRLAGAVLLMAAVVIALSGEG
ncbi:MAG: hypothetical protein KDA96_01885 [Planctomycetaceae bacterium]|nr:hypothetical protein [Planctomycetaceae bacterium]